MLGAWSLHTGYVIGVPTGSPSRNGDVAVHAFDINHNIPPCEGEPTGTIQSMANVGVVGF